MKFAFNRLAPQYIILGCSVLLSAVAALLILRANSDLLLRYGRSTMLLLLGQMIAGIVLIIAGVTRKFKTILVLAQAAPLCREIQPQIAVGSKQIHTYTVLELKSMLKTGTCLVYPSTVFTDRLLYHFFPDISSCSPVLQNQAREHFLRAFTAAIACCLFLLMLFSAFLGLLYREDTAIRWTALLYFYFLFGHTVMNGKAISPLRLILFISGAVFSPLVLSWIGGSSLPVLGGWIFVCLGIGAVLPTIQFWAFFGFLKSRLRTLDVRSQVTTRSLRLQGTLIPEAIYQHFAAAFEKETTPAHRCYENSRGGQTMQGTSRIGRAGSISGDILLESDPAIASSSVSIRNESCGWLAVAITLTGVFGIYVSVDPLVQSANLFVACVMMIVYGMRLLSTVEFFSTECLFRSTVASFSMEGTYNATRTSAAAGAEKLVRMEQDSPNLDVAVKVVCADLISSVFARAGGVLPFQNAPRHVLAFGETQEFANAVIDEMADKMSKQNSLTDIRISFSGPLITPGRQDTIAAPDTI